jgi:hypothetical protein
MIVSAVSAVPVQYRLGVGADHAAAHANQAGPVITPAVDALMFAVVGETIPECAGAEMLRSSFILMK